MPNLLLNCLLTAAICALLSGIIAFWFSMSYDGPDAALTRGVVLMVGPVAGAILGLIIGVLGSTLVARPTYLKFLAVTAIALVAGLASAALVWKNTDREPTIDGKPLDVEFELKAPPGFDRLDPISARPQILAYGDGVNVGDFALDLTHVSAASGGWILHDFFPLKTRRAGRRLDIALKEGLLLSFDIHGEPAKSQFQWSPWIAARDGANFQLRYKLRPRTELVKTEPDEKALEAQAIAALSPGAPIQDWIKHLRYDLPEQPRNHIAAALEKRQPELITMLSSGDAAAREQALTAVRYLNAGSPELNQAILREGRAIAGAIQRLNAMSGEDPQFHPTATELSSRFDDWRTAWWALHNRIPDFDATPLRDIHRFSRHHAATSAMRDVELNSRVMLERLDTPKAVPSQ